MVDFPKLVRKTTCVLFANQSLTSAGFIAAATLSSIIGAKFGGNASFAASANGSLGSGFVFAMSNYMVITIVSGALAIIPLLMSLFWVRKGSAPAGAEINLSAD